MAHAAASPSPARPVRSKHAFGDARTPARGGGGASRVDDEGGGTDVARARRRGVPTGLLDELQALSAELMASPEPSTAIDLLGA
eukprot:1828673-Prymnesium_polylepis.1